LASAAIFYSGVGGFVFVTGDDICGHEELNGGKVIVRRCGSPAKKGPGVTYHGGGNESFIGHAGRGRRGPGPKHAAGDRGARSGPIAFKGRRDLREGRDRLDCHQPLIQKTATDKKGPTLPNGLDFRPGSFSLARYFAFDTQQMKEVFICGVCFSFKPASQIPTR